MTKCAKFCFIDTFINKMVSKRKWLHSNWRSMKSGHGCSPISPIFELYGRILNVIVCSFAQIGRVVCEI